jgi:hypothetical protein
MLVINKKDYVRKRIFTETLKIVFATFLITAALLSISIGFLLNKYFLLVAIVLFILGAVIFVNRSGEVAIWKSGHAGQAILPKMLEVLSDEYVMINNVSLPEKNCDIDHVLVGPKCVYAIESKHYNGEIYGQGDTWGYLKRGRSGGFYKGHIGNPAKQIKRSVWELKQNLDSLLSENGFDPNSLWIEPIVVFTNPNTVLKITEPSVTVLLASDLKSHIEHFECKAQIEPEAMKLILETLKK